MKLTQNEESIRRAAIHALECLGKQPNWHQERECVNIAFSQINRLTGLVGVDENGELLCREDEP